MYMDEVSILLKRSEWYELLSIIEFNDFCNSDIVKLDSILPKINAQLLKL